MCDEIAATSVPIDDARSVAALPGGGFLYIDAGLDLVREVSALGVVSTVAGNGTAVDAPDGTIALDSGIDDPVSVAPLPNGGFLITEYLGQVVRVVSPGGPGVATITTIAGTGMAGPNALSGPATTIPLDYPSDAEPAANGTVLIADTYHNEIRLLSAAAPDATLTTIAGGGSCDDATTDCDGMQAGAVGLTHPVSVSPLQDGASGYLVDEADADAVSQISQLAPSGTFTTVAGIPGDPGYTGDSGPATNAELNHPARVTSTADGGFLIADTNNEVIREVDPSGTIETVAGDGFAGYSGDGGNATAASLDGPSAASPTVAGGILIADGDNGAVREITLAPVSTITLIPATANERDGWYSSVQALVTSNIEAQASASAQSATSIVIPSVNCELDPTEPPPAFGAIVPGCPFESPTAVTGNGIHTLYAASENAFGDQEIPVSQTIMIDTTPPTLTCGPAPSFIYGATGARDSATLTDSVSGPASEQVSAPVATDKLGARTVIITAANNAGIEAASTCDYAVLPKALDPAPVAQWRFARAGPRTTVQKLRVEHVPALATVTMACHGRGCPFSVRRLTRTRRCRGARCTRSQGTVNLTPLLMGNVLQAGSQLTIAITEPDTIGEMVVFTFRSRSAARYSLRCLAPGSSSQAESCPSPTTPARAQSSREHLTGS
ncbi:MAG: hypothetical protein ACLP0J_06390 [Solirubrobacteraceae bacterium]